MHSPDWSALQPLVPAHACMRACPACLPACVLDTAPPRAPQISDRTVNRIGDVSSAYGRAFGVEHWAYELFAEEVIRGGPAFAVSLVITAIEPMLRNAAALGAWQVRRGGGLGSAGLRWRGLAQGPRGAVRTGAGRECCCGMRVLTPRCCCVRTQVISPIAATGRVEVVAGLHEVQDKTYDTPTVLIAEQVRARSGACPAQHE